MGKNKKTVFKGFDYMHCDDFAKYLSEMAAKGWHFKEWGLGLVFEKGEPENVIYAVEVFTDASEYDMKPEPHTKAFAEYCEAAGWKLVDAKKKFCIFKKMQEDAVPILTPEERVQNAYKERRRELMPGFVISTMMLTMQILDLFSVHLFPARIFSPLSLSLLILWVTAFVERCAKLIGLWLWKCKMKQKLAAGESVYLGNDSGRMKIFSKSGFWIAVIAELMCIAMVPEKWLWQIVIFYIGLVVSILVLAMILAKLRPESNTNFIIQTVFSMFYVVTILLVAVCFVEIEREDRIQTDAPLIKADYRESQDEMEEILLYADRNWLGSRESYIVQYKDGGSNDLFYDIYTSECKWIQDRIWNEYVDVKLEQKVEDCTKEWKAEEAFRSQYGVYFVRYENMILRFQDYDDIVLTQDQIDIIRDKLDLR